MPGDRTPAKQEAFCRIRQIVERYDKLIVAANLSMFSEAEWDVLRELVLGFRLCADFARHLDREAGDGLTYESLAEKWEIDGDKFLATVRSLSFAQRLAVVERLEAEEAERRARR